MSKSVYDSSVYDQLVRGMAPSRSSLLLDEPNYPQRTESVFLSNIYKICRSDSGHPELGYMLITKPVTRALFGQSWAVG